MSAQRAAGEASTGTRSGHTPEPGQTGAATPLRMFSVEDVADITGLKPATIRAAVRDGELAATRLRRRIRIAPTDLSAWLECNRIQPDVDMTPPPASTSSPRLRTPPPAGGYRAAARARRAA